MINSCTNDLCQCSVGLVECQHVIILANKYMSVGNINLYLTYSLKFNDKTNENIVCVFVVVLLIHLLLLTRILY